MSIDDSIPNSYEQWRHCIEVKCRIKLTPTYVSNRLEELRDRKHVKTKEFERIYGADHLKRTIAWFERAANELPAESSSSRPK